MAERKKNMKQLLIQAGIEEINRHGVKDFSVRRVAQACQVSCTAPYKHFSDKRELIAAIIEYVNAQWKVRQQEVLARYTTYREQIVEMSVAYVQFLMEKPYFRSILMLKDEEFDNIYHKMRGQLSSRAQQLERDFFAVCGWDDKTKRRKLVTVRSLLFGTVFLCDTGELPYNQEALDNLRHNIDREFDLP